VDDDGSVRFSFEGNLLQPWASAGAPTAVVIQSWSDDFSDGTTVVFDPLTGEELWSEPSGWETNGFLEIDDHLLITSAAAQMLDERTGRELWQVPVDPSVSMYTPVTDGDVVVLPIRDHGLVLVAVDLATGEEQWRMPGPDGVTALGAAGGGLVLAITGAEVVAYRP
jgi:outer membrane protein assembly factor BamB